VSNAISKTKATSSIESLEDALTLCRTLGMRISRQRYQLLELLWQTNEHLSAKEIYTRLNQQSQTVSLTAIYQNIAALFALGLLESILSPQGHLYGKARNSRSYVQCLDTKQILDIQVNLSNSLMRRIIEEVEQQTGIQIVDYHLNFFGYQKS
jgi:Fur family transcriptional regulator, ferric uptake regulator